MSKFTRGFTRTLGHSIGCCVLIGFSLSSCQRYEAQPLALNERLQTWSQQDRDWLKQSFTTESESTGFNLSDGIQLAEAEAISLFFNPSIRITRLQAQVAGVGVEHAKTWKDPELGIDGDYILANVDDPLSIGLSFEISIPLSGRKSAAKQLASAAYNEAEQAVIVAEWALLQELRQAWCEAAATQKRLTLSNTLIDDIKSMSSETRALLDAQMISINDAQSLHIILAQQQQESLRLHSLLTQQQQMIIQLLGLHPQHNWQLRLAIPVQPKITTDTELTATLIKHPLTKMHALAYTVAERQLALEIRKQYPDLRFGFGGGTDSGDSQISFGLGLLPLPVWNKNKQGIATATAEREQIAEQAEQALRGLVYKQHQLRHLIKDQQQLSAHLHETLLPSIHKQLDSSRLLFQQGFGEIFHIIDALRSLSDAQSQHIEAVHQQRRLEIELAALLMPISAKEPTHE